MMDSNTLKANLSQFTGTEKWMRHPLNRECLMTDGVVYFAEQAGAFWLTDILATEFFELQHKAGFLSITLKVEGNQADLIVEDGDYHELRRKHIDFTDCPEGSWEFFFTDRVVLLRSEY